MTKYRIINQDCVEAMKEMPENSVDSIVTDPPYELGFMGKKWDSTGIANSIDMWSEVLRVLKPGGHLIAFSGSRTYHRMVVAIEDAGFEIRDQIMWVYGSGFPKSHNISLAIDKEAGAEREIVGEKLHARKGVALAEERTAIGAGAFGEERLMPITTPFTDEAKQWEGWGTALKPAHEPIVLARKPITTTISKNIISYGTGGLNIDGSRVPREEGDNSVAGKRTATFGTQDTISGGDGSGSWEQNTAGRWPANFIHDGSDEVVDLLGEPARFFYCAKASKRDRNEGLEGFEVKQTSGGGGGIGDYIDDVNSASGKYGSEKAPNRNHHPTVKPTDLMRYLCRLITPPEGTILDPFMGSGSTGKAAVLEGFNFIGCELNEEYIKIAEARIMEARKEKYEEFIDMAQEQGIY